ncbi:MAG TPA: rhodanese-like domain-containing protein [Spirochaetota bacterium]|jgi:rhodanese-related sulfurtransferase|nr:MAG: putative adenylyltransferase/sulfurtransferase MoeZ [Spirochaetes bacterium ADurb.Bin133]HNZ26922.1 rhodanese-like domain-containing protein [Spirochaetota bacterium]HOF00740.1 rhodanese-like domain-containing protein [Spirochaetota bacterium]HOS32503.1 rhodanese-like domain-containing protein [Spirochaetota bacterium]HOS56021.1 rhodanese-like domain-containing protein [Spirochaetota bacterium]
MIKKFVALIFLIILLSGCYEGYLSKDGGDLAQYLEPSKLKELTDAPDENIWIIDVRPTAVYEKSHIPTAKSFPSSEVLKRLNELPKDKSLIVYCETGGRAQAVIKMLEKEGYTKMMNWGGNTRWPYEFEKQ